MRRDVSSVAEDDAESARGPSYFPFSLGDVEAEDVDVEDEDSDVEEPPVPPESSPAAR